MHELEGKGCNRMNQNRISQHIDELVLIQKCPGSDTVCIYSRKEENQSIKLPLICQKLSRATSWRELTALSGSRGYESVGTIIDVMRVNGLIHIG